MKAFISYSHKDKELLDGLHEHLAALRREELISVWTDREIPAGGVIDDHVDAQMEEAQLYLLLISSAFIDSQYCFEKEFARALERQEEGKAIIVPIITRECDWNIPALRKFKALPEDGRPVTSRHWYSRDEAFANVATGLRALIADAQSRGARLTPAAKHPARQATELHFNLIPFRPNPYFGARDAEMSSLEAAIQQDSAIPASVAIVGEGGIGKTQLAISFGYKHRSAFRDIIWLNGESPQSLYNEVLRVARELHLLPTVDASAEAALEQLKAWMRSKGAWLLIADNIDSIEAREAFLRTFEPSLPGFVLVTSRRNDWPATFLRVEPHQMSHAEGGSFLIARGKRPASEAGDAEALSNRLAGLPLALEAAGAWLCKMRKSCGAYFERIKSLADSALADPATGGTEYRSTVATTWLINIQELSAPALNLLEFMSVVSSDPLSEELIADLIGKTEDLILSGQVEPAVEELSSLSLIRREEHGVHQHRLRQLVMQRRLTHADRMIPTVQSAVSKLTELMPEKITSAIDRGRIAQLATHLEAALQNARNVEMDISSLKPAYQRLQGYYHSIDSADSVVELVLSRYHVTTPCTAERASAAADLGGAYWTRVRRRILRDEVRSTWLPDAERAEIYFREALSLKIELAPQDHQQLSESWGNLAHVLRDQERFAEALECCDRALAQQALVSPVDNAKTAIRIANRGLLFMEMFKRGMGDAFWQKAEDDLKESLRLSLDRTHNQDARTVRAYQSLGKLYCLKERWSEAEALIGSAWALSQSVYDTTVTDRQKEHSELGHVRETYRGVLLKLGKRPEDYGV